MSRPLVLKLGGELIETADARARIAAVAATIVADRPLAIVHGGGRAIDAELGRRGIAPRKVDGLRITDAATLETVVSVLAGSANTELVAALVARGVPAVGLTGVDAGFGRAARATAHRAQSGAVVDLGLVGDPTDLDASLVELLLVHGYVPVIASLGIENIEGTAAARGSDGPAVLNVNADVMACRLAASLDGCDLVIAGATPGVLDEHGASIPALDAEGIDAIVASGTATTGMVAKLRACATALVEGVRSVRIIDGRSLGRAGDLGDGRSLGRAGDEAPGTTITLDAAALPLGPTHRASAR